MVDYPNFASKDEVLAFLKTKAGLTTTQPTSILEELPLREATIKHQYEDIITKVETYPNIIVEYTVRENNWEALKTVRTLARGILQYVQSKVPYNKLEISVDAVSNLTSFKVTLSRLPEVTIIATSFEEFDELLVLANDFLMHHTRYFGSWLCTTALFSEEGLQFSTYNPALDTMLDMRTSSAWRRDVTNILADASRVLKVLSDHYVVAPFGKATPSEVEFMAATNSGENVIIRVSNGNVILDGESSSPLWGNILKSLSKGVV